MLSLNGSCCPHKYELKLVASDSLNENATTILIYVRDVNDLPPLFPQTLYERTLNEEIDAPFTITQVCQRLKTSSQFYSRNSSFSTNHSAFNKSFIFSQKPLLLSDIFAVGLSLDHRIGLISSLKWI